MSRVTCSDYALRASAGAGYRPWESIKEQMGDNSAQLAIGIHVMRAALTLAGDAATLYEVAPDEQPARINQAMYVVLHLDEYAHVHHDARTIMFEASAMPDAPGPSARPVTRPSTPQHKNDASENPARTRYSSERKASLR